MDNKQEVDLGSLYRDIVMEHYRAPRGKKILDRIDISREGHNPVCGDTIKLSVKMSEDGVEDVSVDCKGCAISVASASMLAEILPGKSKKEIELLAEAFRKMMHGEPAPEDLDLGDLDALEGVKKFPVRVKCALLAWMTLVDMLREAGLESPAETGPKVTSTEH